MSLFGKKNGSGAQEDAVDDIGAVDEIEKAAAPLSAPAKEAPASGGGNKKFLLFILILLLAGGGGGYYYFTSMGDVAPAPTPAPVMAEAPAPAAEQAPPVDPAAQPAPIADSATAPPAAPTSPDATVNATQDLTAPAATPATTAADATEQPALPPSDVQSPGGADVAPDATPKTAAITPVDGQDEMPPSDLPVPQTEKLGGGADSAAPAQKTGSAPVSDAEKAIVDNADVIDKVSHPTQAFNGTASGDMKQTAAEKTEIVAQPAIVRPVPETYIIVKKDHDASDIDSRLAAGRTALAENKNSAALEIFSSLFMDYPLDKRVLMGRALAYQKSGQADAAIAAYEDVLVKDPKNLEALTNMLGLLKVQDPALAVQKLEELKEIYPYNVDVIAQLGIAYGAKGDYEKAISSLDIADSMSPGRIDIMYNRAVTYDRAGRAGDAAVLYRQILNVVAGQENVTVPVEAIRNRLAVIQ